MSSTKTLPMLTAVDAAVAAFRAQNKDIPEVVIVLGSSGKSKRSQIHGHFAKQAWIDRDGESRTHELFLSGESLSRGGRETFGTIVHELAHAYASENEIQDTSNSGRYHNRKFKEIAEGFGLHIESAPTIGHSVTTVPADLAERYRDQINDLDAALSAYRDAVEFNPVTKTKQYKMQCPFCKDPVPTQKKWFERNSYTLFCESHGAGFEMIEPDEEDD